MKKLKSRKRAMAEEMYTILNDFRRVYYVEGGHPDALAKIAERALQMVRTIDNDLSENKAAVTL